MSSSSVGIQRSAAFRQSSEAQVDALAISANQSKSSGSESSFTFANSGLALPDLRAAVGNPFSEIQPDTPSTPHTQPPVTPTSSVQSEAVANLSGEGERVLLDPAVLARWVSSATTGTGNSRFKKIAALLSPIPEGAPQVTQSEALTNLLSLRLLMAGVNRQGDKLGLDVRTKTSYPAVFDREHSEGVEKLFALFTKQGRIDKRRAIQQAALEVLGHTGPALLSDLRAELELHPNQEIQLKGQGAQSLALRLLAATPLHLIGEVPLPGLPVSSELLAIAKGERPQAELTLNAEALGILERESSQDKAYELMDFKGAVVNQASSPLLKHAGREYAIFSARLPMDFWFHRITGLVRDRQWKTKDQVVAERLVARQSDKPLTAPENRAPSTKPKGKTWARLTGAVGALSRSLVSGVEYLKTLSASEKESEDDLVPSKNRALTPSEIAALMQADPEFAAAVAPEAGQAPQATERRIENWLEQADLPAQGTAGDEIAPQSSIPSSDWPRVGGDEVPWHQDPIDRESAVSVGQRSASFYTAPSLFRDSLPSTLGSVSRVSSQSSK